VRRTEEAYGPVTFLVNNAGIYELGGAESAGFEEWDRVIAVNRTGTFPGMDTTVPSMRRAGAGAIVNISSVHGLVGSPHGIAYLGSYRCRS
jgi:NAD(P)-dependent dehydrogenase (short-subunit alcohol dehydrogenase family)